MDMVVHLVRGLHQLLRPVHYELVTKRLVGKGVLTMWKRCLVGGMVLAVALLLVPGTSHAEMPGSTMSVSAIGVDLALSGSTGSGDGFVSNRQISDPALGAGLVNMALLTGNLANFLDWLRNWLRNYYSNNYHHSDDDDDDGGPHKVPEPATMLLFGAGLLGVGGLSRLRRFSK